MKKYLIIFFVVVIVMTVFLSACSGKNDLAGPNENGGISNDASDEAQDAEPATEQRKIIYEADITLYADNFNDAVNLVRNKLDKSSGEWFDSETVSGETALFVARVKNDRLDAYITDISSGGEVANLEKTAQDISLSYSGYEDQIASLEAERARLNELYENAAISDLIYINTRLSEIDYKIRSLQQTLNSYDSRIEYSKVTVRIYTRAAAPVETPFGKKIGTVFGGAWKALGEFFKFIAVAILAVFPFAVVFVPAGIGIFFLVKYINKRKKSKSVAKATKIGEELPHEGKKEI